MKSLIVSQTFSSLIKKAGVFFGSSTLTFVRLLSGLMLLKVVALISGAPGVAIYAQAQSAVTLVNGILVSSAGNGVVKLVAERPARTESIKTSALQLVSFCALVMAFITWLLRTQIVAWLNIGDITSFQMTVFLLAAVFASIGTLLVSISNGLQKLLLVIKTNILSILGSLVVVLLVLIYLGGQFIILAPAVYLGLIGLFQIGFLIKHQYMLPCSFGRLDFTTIRPLSGYMVMAICSFVMATFVLISIRSWLIQSDGLNVTGDWESSRRLMDLITALLTTYFSMVLLPKMSKMADGYSLRFEILKNAASIALLALISFLCIYLFRFYIYSLIYTSDFNFSEELLMTRAMGEFLRVLVWIFGFILVVRAKVFLYLSTSIIYGLMLLASSNMLISQYGVSGLNYAYILSNLIMLFISIIIFISITHQHKDLESGEA